MPVACARAIAEISKLTFATCQFRGTCRYHAVWRTGVASSKPRFITKGVCRTHLARCSVAIPPREALAEFLWQKQVWRHLNHSALQILAGKTSNITSLGKHVCGLQGSFSSSCATASLFFNWLPDKSTKICCFTAVSTSGGTTSCWFFNYNSAELGSGNPMTSLSLSLTVMSKS